MSDTDYTLPEDALLLHPDGPPLSIEDKDRPLVLIDATWKYFRKIFNRDPSLNDYETRSIPEVITAYPRQSKFREHPKHYLASIEVIYLCGRILRKQEYLDVLDHYYFAEDFLRANGFV